MSKPRETPCNPGLDAALERYFAPEGQTVKSISDIRNRVTPAPSELTPLDISSETFGLLATLTGPEYRAVQAYYSLRASSEELTHRAARARNLTRNTRRSRAFKSGMKEVERKWGEKKKAGR
jgi:hypothetical protein